MGYRELSLQGFPKAQFQIKPGHLSTSFDVDQFGQDDGADPDPDAAFRLIFQLGEGYMIYLYVVGMAQPGDGRFFHEFWLKDCAVAYVDMEDFGAPDFVSSGGPFEVPVLFKTLLISGEGEAREYAVQSAAFEAYMPAPGYLQLAMRWNLTPNHLGQAAYVLWTNTTGWTLNAFGQIRKLNPPERVSFKD